MTKFYVERQYWQRWPRVLLMCKDTGNGIERRRYVPEGGTRDEWNGKVRESVRKLEATRNVLNARINELSDMPNMQAEIDGLQWAVDERDELIRDMWRFMRDGDYCAVCKLASLCDADIYGDDCGMRGVFAERMGNLGIEAGR